MHALIHAPAIDVGGVEAVRAGVLSSEGRQADCGEQQFHSLRLRRYVVGDNRGNTLVRGPGGEAFHVAGVERKPL